MTADIKGSGGEFSLEFSLIFNLTAGSVLDWQSFSLSFDLVENYKNISRTDCDGGGGEETAEYLQESWR